MKAIDDHSDIRHKGWCLHCGVGLKSVITNRDHVPSKCLLSEPYPTNLPVVPICKSCNTSFSKDEEYFLTFISCVLSGTTDPASQVISRAGDILERSIGLRKRIEASQSFQTVNDQHSIVWAPDDERIKNVVVKNARGHAFYEFGEPMLRPPTSVWIGPMVNLSDKELEIFNNFVGDIGCWPEVGSRMMTRLVEGQDITEGGWIGVQPSIYQYAVLQSAGIVVRSKIFDYLATEVRWEE